MYVYRGQQEVTVQIVQDAALEKITQEPACCAPRNVWSAQRTCLLRATADMSVV